MFPLANYRKGGLFLFPFVVLGLLIAYFLGAPFIALLSIGGVGFTGAIILVLLGDKSRTKTNQKI